MDKLYIIKIGSEIIDQPAGLSAFLKVFASLNGKKILVHGGGRQATELASRLDIPQQMLDGRRVTDAETLKVITMVYAGLINKQVVALLQSEAANALGLTGADGDLILAHKRASTVDYGFAGDIDRVNIAFLRSLLNENIIPVLAPVTHDGKGQLLNTNADTIAGKVAEGLSVFFDVHLIYSFGRSGVLQDENNEASVIRQLNEEQYKKLREEKAISAGMIPKLDNAFAALRGGVKKLSIGKATDLQRIIGGHSGTNIINE